MTEGMVPFLSRRLCSRFSSLGLLGTTWLSCGTTTDSTLSAASDADFAGSPLVQTSLSTLVASTLRCFCTLRPWLLSHDWHQQSCHHLLPSDRGTRLPLGTPPT
ncbi:hypothetical protein FKM82_008232 [Ascaphus truei]